MRGLGIVGQSLIPMVLGTLVVAGGGAWLAHRYAAERERDLVLTRIEGRIARQASIESALFQEVSANLGHCRRLLRSRAAAAGDAATYPADRDGVHRATEGRRALFVGPEVTDPVARVAWGLLGEMGPAWCEEPAGMAVADPGRWLAGYGRHYQELVADLLPADPILLPIERELLARPGDAVRWSEAYLEPATGDWRVVALAPVAIEGRQYAAIQEVPVVELLENLTLTGPNISAAVWTDDGQVLATSDGGIGMPEADTDLERLVAAIPAEGPESELTRVGDDEIVGVVRLPLPGWVVATRHDQRALLAPARQAATTVLAVGLAAVLAQIVILSVVLRRRVRTPLKELEEDVERLAAGARDLATDPERRDEVGNLARAFRAMNEAVTASEHDLRQALERLGRSEALYRALFDSAADAVLVLREDEIIEANPSAEVCFGSSRDQLMGASFASLAPEHQADDRPSTSAWPDIARDPGGDARPWLIRRSGGEVRETEVAIGRAAVGERELTVVVMRDVTERNRLEDELQQGQKMESLGQLAGGIAHDFNNMLGAIIGSAELLLQDMSDEDQRVLTKRILQTGERAATLTNRLLAFARRGRSLSTPVDFHRVIHDTVGMLEASIDRRIQLELSLDAQRHTVVGDSSALQNLLLNLGLNARDAMPDGGELHLATRDFDPVDRDAAWAGELPDGDALEVVVRDTGSGIPAAIRERVFEPFFTTKPTGKGTGLGLAAVYRSVLDHGGAIRIESEEGRGTAFHIALPLTEDGTDPRDSGPEPSMDGRGHILVVDDEELVRRTSAQILRTMGYEVTEVVDGPEALAVHQPGSFDLALVDMEMPGMRGNEVLAALREAEPSLPVVLCSGFSRSDGATPLRDQGAAAFLNKPFRLADLSHVLSQVLEDHRKGGETDRPPH